MLLDQVVAPDKGLPEDELRYPARVFGGVGHAGPDGVQERPQIELLQVEGIGDGGDVGDLRIQGVVLNVALRGAKAAT